jgi:ribosome maturation factor RimP
MITKEEILVLLEEIIEDPKLFVAEVKISPSKIRKKVTILIDGDDGILVDDCASISRKLGLILEERIEEAFTLEVSSPGVDFPITRSRQLTKIIGKELKVIFKDSKEIKGTLLSHDSDSFELKLPKKKREKEVIDSLSIKLEEIKEAFVQVSFK